MIVCIIPARGGSKRIPGKNIKPFAGRPILEYPVATARDSGLFDRVIVSTDDERVADIARACGAEVPFLRPDTLSDDHTGTNEVVGWVVKRLRETGDALSLACCIYATAPMVGVDFLRAGRAAVDAKGVDYAMSVTSFDFPVQRALKRSPEGFVSPFDPEAIRARSQDLEPAVHDAAQFYWGRADAFADGIPMYEGNTVGIALPRYLVQDIDTEEDWVIAEIQYEILKRMGLVTG